MKPPEDTATIERDLHAVDAALAGGAARHDDPVARELQELALALRADAPVPEPAFAQDLRGARGGRLSSRARSAACRG